MAKFYCIISYHMILIIFIIQYQIHNVKKYRLFSKKVMFTPTPNVKPDPKPSSSQTSRVKRERITDFSGNSISSHRFSPNDPLRSQLSSLWNRLPDSNFKFTVTHDNMSISALDVALKFFQKLQKAGANAIISTQDIRDEYPPGQQFEEIIAKVINDLLRLVFFILFTSQRLLRLFSSSSGETRFQTFLLPEECDHFLSLSKEQAQIFDIIASAGQDGIWIKSIRQKSNVSDARIRKIIEKLISQGHISQVRNLKARHKKVYILSRYQSDRDNYIDIWSPENNFYPELLEMLFQAAIHYTIDRKSLTSRQFCKIIQSNPLISRSSNLQFSDNQAYKILNGLVYQGTLYIEPNQTTGSLFDLVFQFNPNWLAKNRSILNTVPCTKCHLRGQCGSPKDEINPLHCEYWAQWLSLNNDELF